MSLFNIFKRKEMPSLFSGGNGESLETAVVIEADDSFAGIQAEYAYIASQCGRQQRDWEMDSQSVQFHNGKAHDAVTIVLRNGQVRLFHFEISKLFGK